MFDFGVKRTTLPERLGTPTHCSTCPHGSILPEAAVAPPLVHLPAPKIGIRRTRSTTHRPEPPPCPFLRPHPVFAVRGPRRTRAGPANPSGGIAWCLKLRCGVSPLPRVPSEH
ncbi:hypothetical protein Smic_62460 [Streptomyces microflavus]|uniref:Uncharacterized protein n=1 Tax=Streptomyces microflavus TaxID=1919 RepID=A0A7J0CYU3_STRMI|nr:hypothetical protein Smic_62460 [Streptomyces microflavus]